MKWVQDYGFRLYNPSIGRFLSVDPLSPDYPWYTPYQFAGNMPIWAIDIDGLEPGVSTVGADGETTHHIEEGWVTVTATFPSNASKAAAAYRRQGLHSDANKIMELHRNGMSLPPGISEQINNGQFPSIFGGISVPKDAGGGTTDWQNGIGGDLQSIAYNAITPPLLASVMGGRYAVDLALEMGGNILFKQSVNADVSDMVVNSIPIGGKYRKIGWGAKLLFNSAFDFNADGTVGSVLTGSKSSREFGIELGVGLLGKGIEVSFGKAADNFHLAGDSFITQSLKSGNERGFSSGLWNLRISSFINKYKETFSSTASEGIEGAAKSAAGF